MQHLNKKLVLLALFVLSVFTSYSQTKDILLPTPTEASLIKSIKYPVSYNTGVPSITIPLHTIKHGLLELPIELSYNASGFKAGEQSPPEGLGWSISTDIQITREIRGEDDFINNKSRDPYYLNEYGRTITNSNYFSTISDKVRVKNGELDTQPDKFYYKLINKSGAFYILKNESGISCVPSPFNGIKISLSVNNGVIKFSIIDDDGTQYFFNTTQKTYYNEYAFKGVTGWKCDKIIAANKTDIIEFSYLNRELQEIDNVNTERVEIYNYTEADKINMNPWYNQTMETFKPYDRVSGNLIWSGTSEYFTPLLLPLPAIFNYSLNPYDAGIYLPYEPSKDSVFAKCGGIMSREYQKFNTVSLGFSYFPGTVQGTDPSILYRDNIFLREIKYGNNSVVYDYQDTNNQLKSITVKNTSSNNIIFTFNQSKADYINFHSNVGLKNYTWYLDEIGVENSINSEKQTYQIEYRNKYDFDSDFKFTDAWGGVNRHTWRNPYTSPISVPSMMMYGASFLGNSYLIGNPITENSEDDISPEVDETFGLNGVPFNQSGIIKKITYPTKGSTEFEFESNEIGPDEYGDYKKIGGLRIKSITNYLNSVTVATKKNYDYSDGNSRSSGKLNGYIINNNDLQLPNEIFHYDNTVHFMGKIAQITHAPIIVGDLVTEIVDAGDEWVTSNNSYPNFISHIIRKKETYLPRPILNFSNAGSPVTYKKVTEFESDNGVNTGKTVYKYYRSTDFGFDDNFMNLQGNTTLEIHRPEWYIDRPDSVIQYKYENNQFKPIDLKKYYYRQINSGYTYQSYQCYFVDDFIGVPQTILDAEYPTGNKVFYENFSAYNSNGPLEVKERFETYPISNIVEDSIINIQYENGLPIKTTTSYLYNQYGNQFLKMTKLSDKLMDVNVTAYPTSSNIAFVNNLYQNNMVTYPVGNFHILTNPSKYKLPNIMLPSNGMFYSDLNTMDYFVGLPADNGEAINIISAQFNTYSADNKGALKSCNQAKPYRLTANDTSYWIYNENNNQLIFSPFCPETSSFSYNASQRPVEVKQYNKPTTVYLWSYNNQYPIAQIVNATLVEVTQQLSPLNIETLAEAAAPTDADWTAVNALRTKLPNAQVSTFTYIPLVGTTKVTDPRGINTTYTYDTFWRLYGIYDNRNKALKNINYNYSNQQ